MPEEPTDAVPPLPDVMALDPASIDNAVLQRLIEDVQNEHLNHLKTTVYNRVHNRHNRGSGVYYHRPPRPRRPVPPSPRPAPAPPPRKPPPPEEDAPPTPEDMPDA